VDTVIVGEITHGFLVLLGVGRDDGPDDIGYMTTKIRDLRLFSDDAGRMNRSLQDVGGSVLLVSQFTLYADCRKGRRPSFDAAMPPADAKRVYEEVVTALRGTGLTVATGVFQADMDVELNNDGPVTVLLDSSRAF
jgi:D-tyrosyl-tRNA(Tyr) deacylase